MSEDESEIDSGTKRAVEPCAADCHKPVRLYSQTQSLTKRNVTSDEWIDSKERLLVENCVGFRNPIVAVAFEHIVRGLHSATDCSSCIWIEASGFPIPIGQDTCPE